MLLGHLPEHTTRGEQLANERATVSLVVFLPSPSLTHSLFGRSSDVAVAVIVILEGLASPRT